MKEEKKYKYRDLPHQIRVKRSHSGKEMINLNPIQKEWSNFNRVIPIDFGGLIVLDVLKKNVVYCENRWEKWKSWWGRNCNSIVI